MSNHKYRPALSAAEIQYLIDLCNLDSRPATAEMGFNIASRLKIFALKVNLGLTGAAFVSTPRQSLDQKLGLDSPEERRFAAYCKWQLNPAFCMPSELKDVADYRYSNGLMTPEEEKNHEQL